MRMIRIFVSATTTRTITAGLTSMLTIISSARRSARKAASIPIAPTHITRSSSYIILADIRVSSANLMRILGKMQPTPITRQHLNLCALMENTAHLRMMTRRFQWSWSIKWREIWNSICMPIRLCGVLLRPNIIGIIVSMRTIFKILGEIQRSITMNQSNALYGKKMKI